MFSMKESKGRVGILNSYIQTQCLNKKISIYKIDENSELQVEKDIHYKIIPDVSNVINPPSKVL